MYLARSIEWNGRTAQMVGALPADIVMHARPVGRGYVHLRETGQGLWPGQPSGAAPLIRAHEFHYSSVENLAPGTRFAYAVERGHGIDGRHDGIVHGNLLASYAHLRDVAGTSVGSAFRRVRPALQARRESLRAAPELIEAETMTVATEGWPAPTDDEGYLIDPADWSRGNRAKNWRARSTSC